MASIAILSGKRAFGGSRWGWPIKLAVCTYAVLAPTLAHAHGAASAAVLAPPLITAGLIGFACYWLVMLWPSVKSKDVAPNGQVAPRVAGTIRIKQKPRLRVVETKNQFATEQTQQRRVADG